MMTGGGGVICRAAVRTEIPFWAKSCAKTKPLATASFFIWTDHFSLRDEAIVGVRSCRDLEWVIDSLCSALLTPVPRRTLPPSGPPLDIATADQNATLKDTISRLDEGSAARSEVEGTDCIVWVREIREEWSILLGLK